MPATYTTSRRAGRDQIPGRKLRADDAFGASGCRCASDPTQRAKAKWKTELLRFGSVEAGGCVTTLMVQEGQEGISP